MRNLYSKIYNEKNLYETAYSDFLPQALSMSTGHIGSYGGGSSYSLKPQEKYKLSK